MTDIQDRDRDRDRERLDADEPGAPPGFLLDREDRRTPCAIGLDERNDDDDDRDQGGEGD